jgi:hypothetical protein
MCTRIYCMYVHRLFPTVCAVNAVVPSLLSYLRPSYFPRLRASDLVIDYSYFLPVPVRSTVRHRKTFELRTQTTTTDD